MVASLAVLSLLAQNPLPPPPLVPADVPPLTPALPPPPPVPPAAVEQPEDVPPAGTRLVGSLGAGVVGAAATTGALVAIGNVQCGGSSGCAIGNVYLGLGTVLLGWAAISLGSWGAHRWLGGKSSVGWPMLGAIAGALFGLFAMYIVETAVVTGGNRTGVPAWTFAVSSTGFAAVGAATLSELGNFLSVRESQSVATAQRF
jgi:hypothetical protein